MKVPFYILRYYTKIILGASNESPGYFLPMKLVSVPNFETCTSRTLRSVASYSITTLDKVNKS
jgi:hypothetical protein